MVPKTTGPECAKSERHNLYCHIKLKFEPFCIYLNLARMSQVNIESVIREPVRKGRHEPDHPPSNHSKHDSTLCYKLFVLHWHCHTTTHSKTIKTNAPLPTYTEQSVPFCFIAPLTGTKRPKANM